MKFFKKFGKNEKENSKTTAKERLHLVLAQDRANISADFLDMMKQEIIEVIKKYIDIDEEAIDVRMTNKPGEDGTVGAPALYANIPILTIKNDARKLEKKTSETANNEEEVAATTNVQDEVKENKENKEIEDVDNKQIKEKNSEDSPKKEKQSSKAKNKKEGTKKKA